MTEKARVTTSNISESSIQNSEDLIAQGRPLQYCHWPT